jgi:hypothetical protein
LLCTSHHLQPSACVQSQAQHAAAQLDTACKRHTPGYLLAQHVALAHDMIAPCCSTTRPPLTSPTRPASSTAAHAALRHQRHCRRAVTSVAQHHRVATPQTTITPLIPLDAAATIYSVCTDASPQRHSHCRSTPAGSQSATAPLSDESHQPATTTPSLHRCSAGRHLLHLPELSSPRQDFSPNRHCRRPQELRVPGRSAAFPGL